MESGPSVNSHAALFEDAACGLAQTTDEGVFIRVNTTLCDWLGYSASDLIGERKLQEILTMGGRIFHQTHWVPLLQMQGSLSEVKLDLVHRNGSKIPMVMNAVRRERNRVFSHEIAAFVARDRDRYERELLSSRKRLQETAAEATRLHASARDQAAFAEQMIGIVSHDLRNPLSTIQMGTSLLARTDPNPNQTGVLGRIARASERATRLIADLLDFTQARLGKGVSVSPRELDLRATVADAVDELVLAYPGRELTHVHEGEIRVFADADRLFQLLGNLVSNAMAYGFDGSPVEVRSWVGPNEASISVVNQGAPILSDLMSQMFHPMVRGVHEGDSKRSVGLGLFIVREIAKAHGGQMSVESALETGTTFRATFPNRSEWSAVSA